MPLFQACSNCGSQIHVRRLACPCGHVFRGSKTLRRTSCSTQPQLTPKQELQVLLTPTLIINYLCWNTS